MEIIMKKIWIGIKIDQQVPGYQVPVAGKNPEILITGKVIDIQGPVTGNRHQSLFTGRGV